VPSSADVGVPGFLHWAIGARRAVPRSVAGATPLSAPALINVYVYMCAQVRVFVGALINMCLSIHTHVRVCSMQMYKCMLRACVNVKIVCT